MTKQNYIEILKDRASLYDDEAYKLFRMGVLAVATEDNDISLTDYCDIINSTVEVVA